MRCPSLTDLPAPPLGKTGWPWTVETPRLPECMPNGSPWPRISIVTPSYNQGQFIEETIRSVLLQGYPDLEYIVMDGGSRDSSVEVINHYAHWLCYWSSEEDRGQAHAINKGIARSSGQLFNWVNSDDLLVKGALKIIASAAGPAFDAVAGSVVNFSSEGMRTIGNYGLTWKSFFVNDKSSFHQPGVWLVLDNVKKCGFLPEHINYCFDCTYLVNYLFYFDRVAYVSEPLVLFRLHKRSKTAAADLTGNIDKMKMLRFLWQKGNPTEICSYARFSSRRIAFYREVRRIAASNVSPMSRIIAVVQIAPPSMLCTRFFWGFCRRQLNNAFGTSTRMTG